MRAEGLIRDGRVYTSAIRALGYAGRWRMACDQLDAMRRDGLAPGLHAYGAAINAAAQPGQWQVVEQLLAQLRAEGLQPNAIIWHGVVSAHARGRHVAGVLETLKDMRACGAPLEATIFYQALSGCAWAGDGHTALALLADMRRRGLPLGSLVYTPAILATAATPALLQSSLALLAEARTGGSSSGGGSGVRLSTACVNAVINACAASADTAAAAWPTALALLDSMRMAGPPPDAISYNSALKCLAAAGQWERATALLANMWLHSSSGGGGGVQPVRPSQRAYAAAILACANAKPVARWREALALRAEMATVGLGADCPHALSAAMSACARAGRWKRALQLLRAAGSSGSLQRADGSANGDGGGAAAAAAARNAKNPVLYGIAIAACAAERKADLAERLLREMRVAGLAPSLVHYNSYLKACPYARARAVLAEMVAGPVDAVPQPDVISYNTVIAAAAQEGLLSDALALLRELDAAAAAAANNSAAAVESGESGSDGLAVTKACSGAAAAVPIKPDVFTYNSCITAAAAAARPDAAAALMDEMRARGVAPDRVSYRGALRACAAAGAWRRALDLLTEIEAAELACDDACVSHAIRACCAAAQRVPARALVDAARGQGRPLTMAAFKAFTRAFGKDALYEPLVLEGAYAADAAAAAAAAAGAQAAAAAGAEEAEADGGRVAQAEREIGGAAGAAACSEAGVVEGAGADNGACLERSSSHTGVG
ncbi:hypothetical protein JKP88DRAFT_346364 [Tribonema minus]|uniref:Pentacotripeptide-repeat region of PRORP domain-containing protein n=1 Tax=Tribonema minus TaxID=303371 RepID=A0A835ZFT4_9STRA|nr:hypothetical protein JKP88DRAFT_346364 [Tribonema minus]